MKIREITDWCLDRVAETTLFEMASTRADAIAHVRGLAYQIDMHLIYLYMYPASNARDHWISELNGWFKDINSIYLKPDKKKLKKEDYFKLLFQDRLGDYEEEITGKIADAIATKGQPLTPVDWQSLREWLHSVLYKVCKDLSTKQDASGSQITFSKIENYI